MQDAVREFDLFLDLEPPTDTMESDVWDGLSQTQPCLPSKYFYDARGSELFDAICELPEYYPTRTERRILEDMVPELNALLTEPTILLEYGSGSSTKTQLLLNHLDALTAYVPIDISRDHLLATGFSLAERFPSIRVLPVCADYGQRIPFDWRAPELADAVGAKRMVFFPGSTIGNFTLPVAMNFLHRMRELVDEGGHVLIGVDLVKDSAVLETAYNDADGITAAFNRNMLHHINRRIGSNFRPEAFEHQAIWDSAENRIEMRLIATETMSISLPQGSVSIPKGRFIRTEYSHKYHLDGFTRLANQSGFVVDNVWTDANTWFSVQLLTAV
ncbi:MAG: L-histidine N(alpha)-methyltransferase [Rhodothermales bacterium]